MNDVRKAPAPLASNLWAHLTYLAHSAHTHPAVTCPGTKAALHQTWNLPITKQTSPLEFVTSTACGTPASACTWSFCQQTRTPVLCPSHADSSRWACTTARLSNACAFFRQSIVQKTAAVPSYHFKRGMWRLAIQLCTSKYASHRQENRQPSELKSSYGDDQHRCSALDFHVFIIWLAIQHAKCLSLTAIHHPNSMLCSSSFT